MVHLCLDWQHGRNHELATIVEFAQRRDLPKRLIMLGKKYMESQGFMFIGIAENNTILWKGICHSVQS